MIITTPHGDVIQRAQQPTPRASGPTELRDPGEPPDLPAEAANATIVVTVYNAAAVVRPCLRALHARTPLTARVIVVDDCSDAHTSELIDEEVAIMRVAGRTATAVHHAANQRYTRSINEGFQLAFQDSEWAVALNSDTLVTPGWLNYLFEALHTRTKVAGICPYMSNAANLTMDMPPGASYLDTAARLASLPAAATFPDAVTPVGACMAVSRAVWREHGPFDVAKSPDGYGEECDLWGRSKGWAWLVAPRCYVYHRSHASFGQGAYKRERAAVERFMADHGNYFSRRLEEAKVGDPKPQLQARASRVRVRSTKTQVAFYLNNLQMCGGLLAIEHAIHQLNESGEVEATLAYEKDMFREWRLFSPRFAPIQLSGPADWPRAGGFERGVVVATAWFTADSVNKLCAAHPGLRPAAFIQDREDLFRKPDGSPQYVSQTELESYLGICRRASVVNSNWVRDGMVRDHRVPAASMQYVPIGVDTDLFYPRGRRGPKVRVLSFCRFSTPRRGYPLLREVYRELHRRYGDAVELVTYDQAPGTDVPCLHIGKVPQARLAEEMARADILVEPSYVQGWGMPAQEMMASGGCVVSTDNGGIHNYGVHERNCLIAPVSASKLVDQVVRAVEDAALRKRLGEQAREDMLRLDWRHVGRAWVRAVKRWAA